MCGLRWHVPLVFSAPFKMQLHEYLKLEDLYDFMFTQIQNKRWLFVNSFSSKKESLLKSDSFWVHASARILTSWSTLRISARLSGHHPPQVKGNLCMKAKGLLKSDIYQIRTVKCLLYKMYSCRKEYKNKFKITCIPTTREKYVHSFVHFHPIVFGYYFFIAEVIRHLYNCISSLFQLTLLCKYFAE